VSSRTHDIQLGKLTYVIDFMSPRSSSLQSRNVNRRKDEELSHSGILRLATPSDRVRLAFLDNTRRKLALPPLDISRHRSLKTPGFYDKLVSMTRLKKPKVSKVRRPRRRDGRPGRWLLQDAKARFSELVRRVRTEGPQHVTVHGRDEVVVIAAEEFRRLKGDLTGEVLVAAMQASPYREIDIEPTRSRLPVRDLDL
jgi:prevent-host-death family protein